MNNDRIKRLPRRSMRQGIAVPRVDKSHVDRAVFGFDTEYDSRTGELLSVQLWRPGTEIYCPVPRRFKMTYENLRKLIPAFRAPFLVAFFSLADISKIADWWNARLSDTGLGMLCAESGDMTIFDIGTFWSSDRTFSLRALGKMIGVPKLEWNTSNVSRATMSEPGFKAYAMRDAEICFKGYQFIREPIERLFGVDILHFRSSPSISAYIYRRRLRSRITAPPEIVRVSALRSYWGGRSEIFATGQFRGSIVEVDANSEYPRSAMAVGDLPDGSDWIVPATVSDWHKFRDGFVEVIFAYPKDYAGFYALPILDNGALYWSRAGRSFCTISELRAAIEFCPRLSYHIRLVVGYKTGTRSELSTYLSELLVRKDGSTGSDRYVYKLLANSIIGKLAQNKRVGYDAEHVFKAQALGIPAEYLTFRGYHKIETGSCYWPEAAALILGKARSVLYRAMEKIGRRRLLLCSTDSIVYQGTPEPFTIENIPFDVKTVGDRGTIWREKVYVIKQGSKLLKIAHHALPVGAVLDGDNVKIEVGADEIEVDYKEFVKLPGARAGRVLGSVVPKRKLVSLKPQKWNRTI